ncbi:asparagine synthase-related protein [Streptomyces sp. NPDC058284]|uniref:asparagine synthase-related protein n=1 Tax=unclassified Streptomyces TaxID=2593676 RepID=UPI003658725A
MLTFRLTETGVTAAQWRWTGHRWESQDSYIEPYRHPSLSHDMVTDGASTAVLSRERRPDDPSGDPGPPRVMPAIAFRHALDETRSWSLDRTVLLIDSRGVSAEAGTWAVAPVFITAREGTLSGSWDINELREYTQADRLVDREMARLLTWRHRYGHETVWEGVHRLTERSTALWQDRQLTLNYPAPAYHTHPRRLRPGANVLEAFGKVLDSAVARRAVVPENCAIELSGGMDSSNVAASLSHVYPGKLVAATLLLGGRFEIIHPHRCAIMIDAFSFPHSLTVPVADHLPFGPGGVRAEGGPVSPYDDPWIEAKAALTTDLKARGVTVSFGGNGGDELGSLREFEQTTHGTASPLPQWIGPRVRAVAHECEEGIAPATVVHEATLRGFASRNAHLLRNGLWPVSPLADPELIQFCEWLPRPWREHKTVHRLRLAGLGLSLDVVSPLNNENPAEVLDLAIHKNVIPYLKERLRIGSILADSRYIAPDALAKAIDHAETLWLRSRQMNRALFKIAALEHGLHASSG